MRGFPYQILIFFFSVTCAANSSVTGTNCHLDNSFEPIEKQAEEHAAMNNHIDRKKDPCAPKILAHRLSKDVKTFKEAFGCESDNACVLSAAIREAHQEIFGDQSKVSLRVLYAVAKIENQDFHHFKNNREPHPSENGGNGFGLFQIEAIHAKDSVYPWAQVKGDPLMNSREGAQLIKEAYEAVMRKDSKVGSREFVADIYAAFNQGPSAWNPPDPDKRKLFLEIYDKESWKANLKECLIK